MDYEIAVQDVDNVQGNLEPPTKPTVEENNFQIVSNSEDRQTLVVEVYFNFLKQFLIIDQPSLPPSLGTSNGSLKRRLDEMKDCTHTASQIDEEYGGKGKRDFT